MAQHPKPGRMSCVRTQVAQRHPVEQESEKKVNIFKDILLQTCIVNRVISQY